MRLRYFIGQSGNSKHAGSKRVDTPCGPLARERAFEVNRVVKFPFPDSPGSTSAKPPVRARSR